MNTLSHSEFGAPLTNLVSGPPFSVPAITDRRSTHMLELLEIGFQKDAASLTVQIIELKIQLGQARSFGADYGSPDDWNEVWCQRWDQVELTISNIDALTVGMDKIMPPKHPTEIYSAMTTWDAILANLKEVSAQVENLRTLASRVNPTTPKNWDRLVDSVAQVVGTAESCLLALQLNLELLKKPARAEVDKILQDLMTLLPAEQNLAAKRAVNATQEYDEAVTELNRENHQALGIFDAVKTMFMWVESPEERVIKNHPIVAGTI